jgi:hypothetical protein
VNTPRQVEAYLAASFQCAIVGMSLVNDWKATEVRRASALFCLSLVALVALIVPTG